MTNPRILIVEDESIIADCMKIMLTNEGYCITDIVATGEEAVKIALVRIPTKSAAYSDASRPAVPVDVGRLFRLKSATL